MARSRFLSIAGCGVLALMAGCAGITSVPPDVDATGMPSAEVALQRSVERVDTAMRDLGGRSAASRSMPAAPAVIPAELRRPVTWSWSGPLDAGAKVLADRIGYHLVVTGQPTRVAPVSAAVAMSGRSGGTS